MELQDVRIGMIIMCKDDDLKRFNEIGWVSGLTKNPSGETILIIEWSDGTRDSAHPFNVKIY